MIFARPSSIWALPLPGTDPETAKLDEADIGTGTLGYICIELDKSLKAPGIPSWLTWVIIGAVAVLAVGGFLFYNSQQQSKAPAPAAAPTIPARPAPSATPKVSPLPSSELFDKYISGVKYG